MSEEDFDKEFYLATKDEKKHTWIYESEAYKFSELDILNLIKICIIDKRSKSLGRKILIIYEDSTKYREEKTRERLEKIGIYNEKKDRPTKFGKNSKIR